LAITDVTPRRIGPYELHGLLGEGGIGQVYAAEDTLLGRQVAIKALRPEMSRDRNLIDRFYIEAKSLANLNHPNITTLYALQLDGQEAFMVMELVHGHTLNDLLARVHRLSPRESLAVVAQAVAGLGYAHRRGVVHRDIKPSNMMLTDEGVLKIMDFGIARVRGSQQMTRTGDFQGTLAYASPEQIRGERVDERSDLYSLAIVVYKLLSGAAPFDGVGDYALMTAHLQTVPPPLQGRVPGLDAPTEAALMRALAKLPEDRFASVGEFGQAVGAAALRHESVEILQQLFDRAFREDAEATRVVMSRALAEHADAPTQPTPRASAGPVFSETVSRTPATPAASAPLRMAEPARSTARRVLWPYLAAGGGGAAALAVAGWFFLLPPAADKPEGPPLAKEQPQAAADSKLGGATAPRDGPGPPVADQREAARPEHASAPGEAASPAVSEASTTAPPVAVIAPASNEIAATPADKPAGSISGKLAAPESDKSPASPPDKVAATNTPPSADKAPEPLVRPPETARQPPPIDSAPAKEATTTEPQRSDTTLANTDSSIPADKPAPLAPEASRPPSEPEGKPDLQGKVSGIKRGELEIAGKWVRLYGIAIDRGQPDTVLLPYVKPARFEVVCYRKPSDTYRCYADGQDIARLALQDRVAQLAPNAPTEYRSLAQKR